MNSMILSRKQFMILFSGLIIIYVLAWCMQSELLIKGDVSWLMHLSRELMRGDGYHGNILEINPPLTIFIYTPEIFFTHYCHVSHIIGIRIVMFAYATCSLFLCYRLLPIILHEKEAVLFLSIMWVLSFIDLILPATEFGQRECVMFYCTMPYFLLLTVRLEKKSIAKYSAFLIGVVAGIGFLVKPFFVLSFLLVEFYAVVFSKNRLAIFRSEVIAVILFIFSYLAATWIFFPYYFTHIIPMASRFYYQDLGHGYLGLFAFQLVVIVLMTYVFYFLALKKNPYRTLTTVLLFAFTGCFLAYVIQKMPWYYHFLPTLSLAVLIDTILLFVFVRFSHFDTWIKYSIVSLVCLFFMLYVTNLFYIGVREKKLTKPLIQYIHEHAFHQPVYFLSAYAAYMISVFEEASAIPASRLTYLGWLRKAYKAQYVQHWTDRERAMNLHFSGVLADDLNRKKPKFIFVDRYCIQQEDDHCQRIPYVTILSMSPAFRAAWKHYHLIDTLHEKNAYDYDVYAR